MGVVIPVGFAQVNLTFTLVTDPEPMVVTLGCDAGTETSPVDLANTFHTNFVNAGTIFEPSSFSNQYVIGPHTATIMTDTGPQTGTGTTSRAGTNAGILALPNNCAILAHKRTDRGGRKGRGRSYFPPLYPTEGAVSPGGVLDSVIFDAWQDALTEFLLAMAGSALDLHLLHSEEAGPITPDPIVAFDVSPIIATQRTRLRR